MQCRLALLYAIVAYRNSMWVQFWQSINCKASVKGLNSLSLKTAFVIKEKKYFLYLKIQKKNLDY